MAKLTIFWDDEHSCGSTGPYNSLEEAKEQLEIHFSAQKETADNENLNSNIVWDDDKLGFTIETWSGDNKSNADDYFERYYRIYELDKDGIIITDDDDIDF